MSKKQQMSIINPFFIRSFLDFLLGKFIVPVLSWFYGKEAVKALPDEAAYRIMPV